MEHGTAELCNLFSSSTRLKLFALISGASAAGISVSALALECEVSISAASQHLSKLKGAGLVQDKRQAQTILYRVREDVPLPWLVAAIMTYENGGSFTPPAAGREA